MGRRLSQIPIAIDQFVNTLFGGWRDETISVRQGSSSNEGKGWRFWRCLIDCIFSWQKDHCKQAYRSELVGNSCRRSCGWMAMNETSVTSGRS